MVVDHCGGFTEKEKNAGLFIIGCGADCLNVMLCTIFTEMPLWFC